MKKLLILIAILLLFVPIGFCEDFPPRGGKDEYPIYWYLHEYAECLKKAMDKKWFFKFITWEVDYVVRITKDGEVIPLEVEMSAGKHYDKIAKDIILSNPPQPFGDDIKLDSMVIGINLIYAGWQDDVYVAFGPRQKTKEKIYWLFIQKEP